MLAHQKFTLAVAVGTLVLTVLLAILVPKGFFPCRTRASYRAWPRPRRTRPSEPMATRQRELAQVILEDPAVESVVFFVGVDGINQTMATSRLSIELRPLDDRDARAPVIARRIMQKAATLPA